MERRVTEGTKGKIGQRKERKERERGGGVVFRSCVLQHIAVI